MSFSVVILIRAITNKTEELKFLKKDVVWCKEYHFPLKGLHDEHCYACKLQLPFKIGLICPNYLLHVNSSKQGLTNHSLNAEAISTDQATTNTPITTHNPVILNFSLREILHIYIERERAKPYIDCGERVMQKNEGANKKPQKRRI